MKSPFVYKRGCFQSIVCMRLNKITTSLTALLPSSNIHDWEMRPMWKWQKLHYPQEGEEQLNPESINIFSCFLSFANSPFIQIYFDMLWFIIYTFVRCLMLLLACSDSLSTFIICYPIFFQCYYRTSLFTSSFCLYLIAL